MKSQAEILLQEFRSQIDNILVQLENSIDADDRDQLEFALDEYKKMILKLERILTQRELEHEQA